jgi:hypothetical protein
VRTGGSPSEKVDRRPGRQETNVSEHTEDAEAGENEPSLRQRLHAATGDRDAEAEVLADRAGDDVGTEDAKVAVQKAHGESVEGTDPDHDIATVDDAEAVAEED